MIDEIERNPKNKSGILWLLGVNEKETIPMAAKFGINHNILLPSVPTSKKISNEKMIKKGRPILK